MSDMDRFERLIEKNIPADMPEFRRSTVVMLMRLAHEDGKNEILQQLIAEQIEKQENQNQKGGEA